MIIVPSALAGAVCAAACFGYAAAAYLPAWGLAVAGLRVISPESDRRQAGRLAVAFIVGLAVVVGIGWPALRDRLVARASVFVQSEARLEGRNELVPLCNLIAPVPGSRKR